MSSPFVRPFSEIGLNDRPSVGGKGASLGELTRAGIAVPPGFVVSTHAFEHFLAAVDRDGSIRRQIEDLRADDLQAITTTSNAIRERIERSPFPSEIEAAIAGAHASLCCADGSTTVAVRSSATSEDSDEASFAGLQDTFLWLRGAHTVIRHVRTCWASLYSTESVNYRRRLAMREDGLAMGVVVQRMVDARCSGVMFTRSPTTGDRSVIVIEGSYGLGSCIVSGEVTPDKFVFNKVTGETTDRAISHKSMQHVPDRENGGVLEKPVAESRAGLPCLADDEISALAAIARKVERHYGRPQDIEWSIAADGEIYLLQSRPETVWSRRDATPIAQPNATALDHVFAVFGGKR